MRVKKHATTHFLLNLDQIVFCCIKHYIWKLRNEASILNQNNYIYKPKKLK